MPKVSVIVLTKNRATMLERALRSLDRQTFLDVEVVVVDDGSTDGTSQLLSKWSLILPLRVIYHDKSLGIIESRQEALEKTEGELAAFLDDDDEWVDPDKLKKQVGWFQRHLNGVLVGGGIYINSKSQISNNKQYPISNIQNLNRGFRPVSDVQIRRTMLLRNNFFTSTVMFKRQAALQAGGFVKDGVDLAEDYDLWLRMGKMGEMGNFNEVFTAYTQSSYNKDRFRQFLKKQLQLITTHRHDYPYFWAAWLILRLRLILGH